MPTIKFSNNSSVVVTAPAKKATAAAPAPPGRVSQTSAPSATAGAASPWSRDQTLHLAVAYSNPQRWATRSAHAEECLRHLRSLPNIRLYVVELAYGDRPFEITMPGSPTDLQLRSTHELWHKENLLNLMIGRFPLDWKYGAWCDGDFHFTRGDLGLETIQQLQRYDWVQMFSTYANLGPDQKPMNTIQSFAANYMAGKLDDMSLARGSTATYGAAPGNTKTFGGIGATGGAWAFRRESLNAVGGLLDVCILGSGDWHMAIALASKIDANPRWDPHSAEMTKVTPSYAEAIRIWHDRAAAATKRNIGVVDCHAVHYYHGTAIDRGYGYRWKILGDYKFNPRTDIYRDYAGVWQLTPSQNGLRDAIRKYFGDRNEDAVPTIVAGPVPAAIPAPAVAKPAPLLKGKA